MALGYYKGGVWVPLLSDSSGSVDDANLIDGLSVGDAIPRADGGATYYGIPGSGVNGWGSFTLAGTRPAIAYSPLLISKPLTISSAVYMVATANTATIEIYLQKADADWQPISGTRVTVATGLDALVAGVNEVTGLSVALTPGRWLNTFYYDTNNYAGRVWSADVPDTPMLSTTNMQSPGRIWRANAVSTPSDRWTYENQSGGTGTTRHFVLYKWSWT